MLVQGNERFVENKQLERDLVAQVKATAKWQYPYAVVLGCMDSRVPPEIVFDQGIGDIFSCRIAGNIVDNDSLGSMEFACKVAGAKLILVLGHTDCRAVISACDHVQLGHLTGLLQKVKPAIDITATEGERNSKNKAFVEGVSKNNVLLAVKTIRESPILKELIDKGELLIVGGMYDVDTGKVTVYEE
jgi:carbonic anhydrase